MLPKKIAYVKQYLNFHYIPRKYIANFLAGANTDNEHYLNSESVVGRPGNQQNSKIVKG